MKAFFILSLLLISAFATEVEESTSLTLAE